MPKVTLEPFDLIRDQDRLACWLAQPHVERWWGDAARAMQHARDSPVDSQLLITADRIPAGYLCWKQPSDEELAEAALTDLPRGLVDVDILIGEVALIGRGIGSRALELLLAHLRGQPDVAYAGLGTSASNTRAIRCFAKAGFRQFRDFDDPEWGPCMYLIAVVHEADER